MDDKTHDGALQILLVEDNPTDVLLLEEALEEVETFGDFLTYASRLDEALGLLRNKPFDVVLLDLGLPDSRGLETFVRMQREHPAIPILILSGLDDNAIAIRAVQAGAQDYLVKGRINSTMLARTICYAIERNGFQQKLIASEVGYRRLFETAQDGIFLLNANTGQITDANPYLEKLLGYTLAEFIGKRLWEIGPFRDKAASQAAFRTLQETGYIRYDDLPLATNDGRQINVEFVSNVYGVGDKQVIQCNIRDISERVRAEAKLRESEARKTAVFETALDCIISMDDAGHVIEFNPAAEKTLGYTRDEAIGQLLADLIIPPALREQHHRGLAHFLATGEGSRINKRIEVSAMRADGTEFMAELAISPVRLGERTIFTGYLRDITERLRAEAAKRESQRFLQSTLDALASHIAVLDGDGKIIAVNKAWRQFSEENEGTAAACGIGVNYSEVCAQASGAWAEEAPAIAQGIQEIMTSQHEAFCLEYPCHSSTEERWFNVCVTRFVGQGPVRVVVAHENITARKQAEQALEARTREIVTTWESMSDAFFSLDTQWRFTHVNSECERLVHKSPQELIGASFWDAFPETAGSQFEREYHRAVEKQVKVDFEEFYPPLNSWFEVHAYPSSIGLSVYFRDITQRKEAEAALTQLAAIVKTSANAITSWTLDSTITSWNAGAEALYGYSSQEAIGASLSMLIPTDRTEEKLQFLTQIRQGKRITEYETIRVCKDGRHLDVSLTLSPIQNEAGESIGASVIARDITARKRAEESLRHSEERYRSLALATAQIVWATLPDGTVEDGPPWRAFTGQSLEEVRGWGWMEAVHPDDREAALKLWSRCIETKSHYETEFRIRAADGSYRLFAVCGVPILESDGSIREWVGTCTDIYDQRQAEEERDRFFTLSLDMLAIVGSDGYMKRLNPAFEATLGYSDTELMAVPFLEFVHPDDIAGTLVEMAKLTSGTQVMPFENRYRCRNGSYKWLRWMSAPFEDLWYCVAHDVTGIKQATVALHKANDELELNVMERTAELSRTNEQLQLEMVERRRTDEALYKSHEFLEAVLENTAEGIVACDAEGQLTFLNRATREFHGLPQEPLPADQWSQHYSLYLPDGITPMRQEEVPLFKALSGEHVRNMEMVIAPREGSPRLLIANGEPLFDADGEKLGAVAVMHDITERKQAEMELQRAKEEADRANLAKSEFLSRMSHELRTPLNAILGFGQVLQMRELKPRETECVSHIVKGGQHLLELINEVLDIARVEAGHISLSLEPVGVFEVLQETLDMVAPLAEQRGIKFNIDVVCLCQAYTHADRQRLKQVLLNLFSNAIKYNHEGGHVAVSCEAAGEGQVRIKVKDSGRGMTPENLQKLFTPFERLGAEKSQIEGTGLGLTLSRRLVEAMGGVLEARSVSGQGSTFSIVLPTAEAPLSQPDLSVQSIVNSDAAVTAVKTRKVLAIEDNPANLTLMEIILEGRPDVALLGTAQGSVGLEMARQHRPHLILLDLHLPDMSGLEVLQRLGESVETRDIPVVVVSADAIQSQIDRLLDAGVKYYLTKPLNVAEFLKIIDEMRGDESL